MTDLKSLLQIILQNAGYSTWLGALDQLNVVGFEDAAVMGFACIFKDVSSMRKHHKVLKNFEIKGRRIVAKPADNENKGNYVKKSIENHDSSKNGVETDEQILEFIRQNAETIYHPVGSCKMGNDPMAVVDDRLAIATKTPSPR